MLLSNYFERERMPKLYTTQLYYTYNVVCVCILCASKSFRNNEIQSTGCDIINNCLASVLGSFLVSKYN